MIIEKLIVKLKLLILIQEQLLLLGLLTKTRLNEQIKDFTRIFSAPQKRDVAAFLKILH
jgi:hypothetical protein